MKMTLLKPGSGYPDSLATVYVDGDTNIRAFLTQKGRTEGGKTVAQVKAEKPDRQTFVLPLGDAMKRIEAAQDAKYLTPWHEINAETYEEMLNVLPPQKWESVGSVSIFRMCEYMTSNITAHYAQVGDRYFAGQFRTSGPTYAQHAAELLKLATA